jgi:hypothetical protein
MTLTVDDYDIVDARGGPRQRERRQFEINLAESAHPDIPILSATGKGGCEDKFRAALFEVVQAASYVAKGQMNHTMTAEDEIDLGQGLPGYIEDDELALVALVSLLVLQDQFGNYVGADV